MRTLLLILVLTTAGAPVLAQETVPLKAATLIPTEGPPKTVEGGVWLSDGQLQRVAERLKACSPETLQVDPGSTTGEGVGWVAPASLALGIGLLGGFLWGFSSASK